MHQLKSILLCVAIFIGLPAYSRCQNESCCSEMGGVQYCDSSAGRLVCKNGEYSDCYCTRHAVMDLQKLTGCCLWKGGVLKIDPIGTVMCRDGGYSEGCTLQNPVEGITSF
ncbi:MAG: neurogenic locus notch [Legionellaceae bacterium]